MLCLLNENAQCNPIQLLNPAPLGSTVGRGQCVDVIVGGQETQVQDYSGYTYGEGPFQEIIGATWLTCDADESLIFGDDHAGKWTRALAKIGVAPERLSGLTGRA